MPTRQDVARRAGVSPSTVSYVLSGQRSISAATRARVMKAVAELGYVPNSLASGLAGGKARTIALVVPGGDSGMSPAFIDYINGTATEARSSGYNLVLYTGYESQVDEIRQLHLSGSVAGVILMEIQSKDARLEQLLDAGIPFVMIGRTADNTGLDYVDRDVASDAHAAVQHLASLGHRRVLYLERAREVSAVTPAVDIRIREALLEAALHVGIAVAYWPTPETQEGVDTAITRLQQHFDDVSGVISGLDLATLGFVSRAGEADLRVPERLSVVSLVSQETLCEMAHPRLTSISLPSQDMGRRAAQILIQRLEGDTSEPVQELVRGQLNVRNSTMRVRST